MVVIIGVVPKKGALHGYKVAMPVATRRKILMKVAKMEAKLKKGGTPYNKMRAGVVAVIRRLNLLAVYNKRNPEVSKVMRSDIKYMQKIKDKYPRAPRGVVVKKRSSTKKQTRKSTKRKTRR